MTDLFLAVAIHQSVNFLSGELDYRSRLVGTHLTEIDRQPQLLNTDRTVFVNSNKTHANIATLLF
jgi:hypothetical protein